MFGINFINDGECDVSWASHMLLLQYLGIPANYPNFSSTVATDFQKSHISLSASYEKKGIEFVKM